MIKFPHKLVQEKVDWYLWKQRIQECNTDIPKKALWFWKYKFHIEGHKKNRGEEMLYAEYIYSVWKYPMEPCYLSNPSNMHFHMWMYHRVRESEPKRKWIPKPSIIPSEPDISSPNPHHISV